MKIPRALLLAFATSMSGALGAGAQQRAVAPSPEALAAARELSATMSGDLFKGIGGNPGAPIWASLEQALRSRYPQLDAATSAEMQREFERQMADLTESVESVAAIYARYLTVAEMREMQAFYSTPTGAKALKVMPQIMGEVTQNLAPRIQGAIDRIDVALMDILHKHGYDAR
jgi:uncharacterized protein